MNAPCADAFARPVATARFAAPGAIAEPAADCRGSNGAPGIAGMLRMATMLLPVLLALLLFCGNAFGNEGRLILVSGEVRIDRALAGQSAASIMPANGALVTAGDTIVTGAGGRAQIRFSDGSLVSLQPRSEFRIDDYQFNMAQQRGFFSLVRGALRTISGAVGKRDPADYRMTTPTATIGIRGTEFLVEETVCMPACHPGRTAGLRVAVSAGRVVVYNAAGSIEVPAGGATYVADAARAPVPTGEKPTMSTAPSSIDFGIPGAGTRLAGLTPGIDTTAGVTATPVGPERSGAQRRAAVSGNPNPARASAVDTVVAVDAVNEAAASAAAAGRLVATGGSGPSRALTAAQRQMLGIADGVPPALLDQWSTRPLAQVPTASSNAAAAPLSGAGTFKAGKPEAAAMIARANSGEATTGNGLAAARDGGAVPSAGGNSSSLETAPASPGTIDLNRPGAPGASQQAGSGFGGADSETGGYGSGHDPVVVAALAPVNGSTIPVGDATGTNNQRGPNGLPIAVGGLVGQPDNGGAIRIDGVDSGPGKVAEPVRRGTAAPVAAAEPVGPEAQAATPADRTATPATATPATATPATATQAMATQAMATQAAATQGAATRAAATRAIRATRAIQAMARSSRLGSIPPPGSRYGRCSPRGSG